MRPLIGLERLDIVFINLAIPVNKTRRQSLIAHTRVKKKLTE
tara:strand:- start:314 stop:439 length:126 start_codon:yes stop_codon:yes gene_type:complete